MDAWQIILFLRLFTANAERRNEEILSQASGLKFSNSKTLKFKKKRNYFV